MSDLERYIEPAITLARTELPNGGVKVIDCPKCTSKLTILISSINDRAGARCQAGNCLKTGPS